MLLINQPFSGVKLHGAWSMYRGDPSLAQITYSKQIILNNIQLSNCIFSLMSFGHKHPCPEVHVSTKISINGQMEIAKNYPIWKHVDFSKTIICRWFNVLEKFETKNNNKQSNDSMHANYFREMLRSARSSAVEFALGTRASSALVRSII